ncbi:MAG: ATP-dependent DNA helicase RecG [Clostridia bacterium]|nr:ATP-dependent DNA helicase RecG [Clostridia bacterium]
MIDLNKDIKYIKGVGPNRATLLNKLGIYNLKDLITYFPREHEDRGKAKGIAELEDGEEALICAYPVARMNEIRIRGNLTLCKLIVRDETGTMQITWYNQSYLKNTFKPNERYKFFGKVSKKYGKVEMQSPVYETENSNRNTGKIIPIYPLTYSLTQNTIRKIIESGLNEIDGKLEETLPKYILDKYNLYDYNTAIRQIHFPDNFANFNLAKKRLVFEELFSMQLALLSLKNKYEIKKPGIEFSKDAKMSDVIDILPFKPTGAQRRVLEEIDRDMESNKPMNRLLQGDVGSGKTVVALIAAYKAVKSGYQAVIMAPTAILATQHLETFNDILKDSGIKCELLISGISKKKKTEMLERLEKGEIDILIGTHAVLEDNVKFNKLGLVVTDEQHRFGVRQRSIIVEKGNNPDVLVMTATPIPRTLALILYGDLDISIIDELPPNRKKIETYAVTKGMEQRVNNFIVKNVQEGRQCYVVCPLVEENEEIDAKSVMEIYETYKKQIFPDLRVEYLHGKMKQKEKDAIMEEFKNGNIDILISTTVIEVGVNVPNSNIMIIENAERFGLAQLHQLRGRVGRGEHQSYCILKYQGNSQIIRERMKVISSTNDGFVISEKDLELRGSGEFFGTKQHGIPEFKIANLFEDIGILKQVQGIAMEIIDHDPLLEKEENQPLRKLVDEKFKDRIEI